MATLAVVMVAPAMVAPTVVAPAMVAPVVVLAGAICPLALPCTGSVTWALDNMYREDISKCEGRGDMND